LGPLWDFNTRATESVTLYAAEVWHYGNDTRSVYQFMLFAGLTTSPYNPWGWD
jgi:hypothetical protein